MATVSTGLPLTHLLISQFPPERGTSFGELFTRARQCK